MSIFGYLIRSYHAKVIKTIFRTKSNVEYRQHKISGNACGRIAEIRGMQALYPAAVVSVQIAEVPDLVFFRFAHVTISVRQVFSVAEAARPMLDRLKFDFPSVHAVEQAVQAVQAAFGPIFPGFGEQIHRSRLETESVHSPHGSSEWTVSRTGSS